MTQAIRNFFLIISVFIVFPIYSFSSSSSSVLLHNELSQLTMKDGLSDNIITCIYQDQDRFMWFGSNNGLSRYDGTHIQNFSIEDIEMEVSAIQETPDGKLWIIANNRLYCFDRSKEEFIKVTSANGEDIIVAAMEIMNDSLFWTVRNNNLECLQRTDRNMDGKTHTEISVKETYSDLLEKDEYFMMLCTAEDGKSLCLATNRGNVLFFDKINRKITRKINYASDSGEMTSIMAHGDYIWISFTRNGVARLHIPTERLDRYQYDNDEEQSALSHTDSYGIIPVGENSYIAITWNGFTLFVSDENDPSKLIAKPFTNTSFLNYRNIETRMISAYYDKEGILWIGTRGGGIIYFDFRQHYYEQYHSRKHNEIITQVADDEGRIWLGTFHEGIMRSDEPYNKSRYLQFSTVDVLKGIPVVSAMKDPDSNLWFGNATGDLICYNWKSKSYHTYPLMHAGKKMNANITALMFDNSHRFWICTSSGLFLFDQKNHAFKSVSLSKEMANEPYISAICEDKQYVWLGTNRGLMRLSGNSPDSWEMVDGYEQRSNIQARRVLSLLAGKDGAVYIGYANGFGVISTGDEHISSFYTVKDGLCNDHVSCIAEDHNGYIWIGNTAGISRYSRHQRIFYNYYISSSNRSLLFFNNTLFLGNNRSLTYFEPDKVISAAVVDKILFTQLEINNKQVNIGEKVNGQNVLQASITHTNQLKLANSNRDFSLHFSNLAFIKDIQKYSYRLSPYQQEWIVTETGKVSYTNLPAGKYMFEVKALFSNDAEGSVTSLPITILPHWSQTIWFLLFVILLISLLIGYVFYFFWRRQHRLQKLMQLKHELTIAQMERNAERQMRKERENFFTSAAHELRTPLTLILAPVQDIMRSINPSDKWYSPLNILHENCLSLQTLVNQLLYVPKLEAGMVKLRLSDWDITQSIHKLTGLFQQMAILKKREFIVKMDFESLNLWVDVEKIESAIRNLLSNAFKYTSSDAVIELSVSEEEFDGISYCLITVSDTGAGIPEEEQKHLFDSFVTGQHAPEFSTSIGIGLYIVKYTMDMHHGFVTLNSSVGSGSQFVLHIPKGFSHFEKDKYEIVFQPAVEEKIEDEKDRFEIDMQEPVYENTNLQDVLLIIEDHDDMREYLRSLFRDKYKVITAENGEKGVAMASEYIPKLIISDIMMPVKNGFECCREIRENNKTFHIPIIMLTAKAEDIDRLKSLSIGVDDYIMKPFNSEFLKEKVHALIKQREQLKRLYTKTLMLDKVPEAMEEHQDTFMQRVIRIIEANLSNEDFNVVILADKLNMSQPTLYRKVKQKTNLSVIEVIRGVRMSKAAAIIMGQQYASLAEVAGIVGYDSMNAFRKHFVAQFGVLPSKYMEEINS